MWKTFRSWCGGVRGTCGEGGKEVGSGEFFRGYAGGRVRYGCRGGQPLGPCCVAQDGWLPPGLRKDASNGVWVLYRGVGEEEIPFQSVHGQTRSRGPGISLLDFSFTHTASERASTSISRAGAGWESFAGTFRRTYSLWDGRMANAKVKNMTDRITLFTSYIEKAGFPVLSETTILLDVTKYEQNTPRHQMVGLTIADSHDEHTMPCPLSQTPRQERE